MSVTLRPENLLNLWFHQGKPILLSVHSLDNAVFESVGSIKIMQVFESVGSIKIMQVFESVGSTKIMQV